MASFSADPSTLRVLILQAGQGFYIPVYQRDFTWDEDEINRLFEDLDHGITRAAAGQSPSTFLGSVILVSDRTSVTSQDVDAVPTTVLHVVDGQQRLTTILTTFGVLARFIAEQMLFLEAEIAGGSTATLDQWLLNMLGERREELLNAVAITTYSGAGVYKMKPRLIRQTHDEWGNNATTAKYLLSRSAFVASATSRLEKRRVAARVTGGHPDEALRLVHAASTSRRTKWLGSGVIVRARSSSAPTAVGPQP